MPAKKQWPVVNSGAILPTRSTVRCQDQRRLHRRPCVEGPEIHCHLNHGSSNSSSISTGPPYNSSSSRQHRNISSNTTTNSNRLATSSTQVFP